MARAALCVLFACLAVVAISQTCDVKTLTYTELLAGDTFTVDAKTLSGITGILTVNKGTGSASVEYQRGQGYNAAVTKGLVTITRTISTGASQLGGANVLVTLALAALAIVSQRGSLAALALVLAIATVALAACATTSTVNVTVVVDQSILKTFVLQVKANPTTNACPTDVTVEGDLKAWVTSGVSAGICSYTFTNDLFGCPNSCGDVTLNVKDTTCVSGVCTLECNAGFQPCNNNCQTASDAVTACGSCTNNCNTRVQNVNNVTCVAGTCGFTACAAGFSDCDNDATNGCEPTSSVSACGSCTNNCTALPGINTSAAVGCNTTNLACTFTCAAGFLDCSASAGGCEASVTADTSCGSCTNDCTVLTGTNAASATCNATKGGCEYVCNADFADCDSTLGCETSITSAANCGRCGNNCLALPGVADTTSCNAGTCQIVCAPGFANCDGDASNGCEVNTNSNATACGSCSKNCETLPGIQTGSATCSNGLCSATCAAGRSSCGGSTENGCPVDTNTDAANCGSCGNDCPTVVNAAKACTNGTCDYTDPCNTGFLDCDNSRSNGCEASATDAKTCGSCAQNCLAGPNVQDATCASSKCTLQCLTGFSDCDASPANGCEVNINTNVSQCGKCGVVCDLPNTNTYKCNTGVCESSTCATGFSFCSNAPTAGCTIDLNKDAKFCGSCTATPCASVPNVNPTTISCSGGVCQVATNCASGFNDCDSNVANGCETPANRCVPAGAAAVGQTCSAARGYTNSAFNVDCAALVGQNNVVSSTCDISTGANAGTCIIGCATGFADCNGDPRDGCEAASANCGSALTQGVCQTALKDPQGQVSCAALKSDPVLSLTVTQTAGSNVCNNLNGLCTYQCAANFYDCDKSAKNGCEVDTLKCPTTTDADCVFNLDTRCGSDCVNCLTLSGTNPGTATCDRNSLQCQFNCPQTLCRDVDGLASNGCESAQAYISFAGRAIDCSKDIDTTNVLTNGPILCDGNATSTTAGLCRFTCKPGFRDCDANPINGCETQVSGPGAVCSSCNYNADVSCGQNKCVDCTLLEGTLGSDYANGRWAAASASTCLPVNASLENRFTEWYCDTSVHYLNPRFDPPDGDNGACQSELCRDLDGDWSNGCESAQQYGRGRFYYYGDSTNTDAYLVPYVPNPYEDRFYEYKAAFTAFPESNPSILLNPIADDIKILSLIKNGQTGVSGLSLAGLYWNIPNLGGIAGSAPGPTSFSQSYFGFSISPVITVNPETSVSAIVSPSSRLSGREIALLHYAADVFTEVDEPAEAAAMSILGDVYENPVDCVLSEWSQWGKCTYADDCIRRDYFLMTRIRTREVITPASGGGVCHLPLVEDFYRFSHRNSDRNRNTFVGQQQLPAIGANFGADYQHGGGFGYRVDYTGSNFVNTVFDANGLAALHWGPEDWDFENLWNSIESNTAAVNDPKILSWTGNEINNVADRQTAVNAYGFTVTCAPRNTCPDVNQGLPKIPCNITAWSEWSACSASCDGDWAGGVRVRTRTVIQGAAQNGECFETEFDQFTGLPLPLYGARAGMLYEEDWQCNDHSCASYDCNTLKDPAFAAQNHIYLGADAVEPQCDGRDWPEYVNGIFFADYNRDGLDDNTQYTVLGDSNRVYPVAGNFPLWNTVYNLSYEFRWPGHCIYECEDGWFDCDHEPQNGCETNGDFCSIDVEFGSTTQLKHPIKPWEHPHGECTIAWKHDPTGVVARDCTNFDQLNPELENTVGKCVPQTGLCDLTCNQGYANCEGDGCIDVSSSSQSGFCGSSCVDCTQLNLFKYGYASGWSCQAAGDDFTCKPSGTCYDGCSNQDGDISNGCETAVYEQWPYPDVTPFDAQMDAWSAWTVCSRSDDCGYLWDMSTSGGNVFRNVPLQTRYRRPTASAYNGGFYPEFTYKNIASLRIGDVSFPSNAFVSVKLGEVPDLAEVLGMPLVQTPFYEVRICPNAVTPCIECTNQLVGIEEHCTLSEWTKWSACSAECVDRIVDPANAAPDRLPWDPNNAFIDDRIPFQIRTRSVLTPAKMGGRCPPPLDTWQQAEADSHVQTTTGTLIDDYRNNRLLSAKASFLVDIRKCNTEKCEYPEDCDALNYWYPGHFASIATCGPPTGNFYSAPRAMCVANTGFSTGGFQRADDYQAGCNPVNGYCDTVNGDLRDGCDTFVYPTHCGRPDGSGRCEYSKFHDCTTLPGVASPFAAPCVIDPEASRDVSAATFADPNPAIYPFNHVCDIRWACNKTLCTSETWNRRFADSSLLFAYSPSFEAWEDGCEVARNYRYPFVTVDTNFAYTGSFGNPISIFYDKVESLVGNSANSVNENVIVWQTFFDPAAKYTMNASVLGDNSGAFSFDCHAFLYSEDFCGDDGVMEPATIGSPYLMNAGCHLAGKRESDAFYDLGFGCNGAWNTPNAGMCVLNCAAGYVDADSDPRNGCETDLLTDATPEDRYVWVGNCRRNVNNGVDVTTVASCGADLCVNCNALPGTLSTANIPCVLAEERLGKIPVLAEADDYYSIQYACGILTQTYKGEIDFNDVYCNANCVDGDKDWTNGCEQGRGYTGGNFYTIGTVYDALFDAKNLVGAPDVSSALACNPNFVNGVAPLCDRRSSGFEYPVPGAWFYQALPSLSGDVDGLSSMTYNVMNMGTFIGKLGALNSLLTANNLGTTTAIAMLNNRSFDCSLLYSTELIYGLVGSTSTQADPFGKYRYYGAGDESSIWTFAQVHHINTSVYPGGAANNICDRGNGRCLFVCQNGWDDYDQDPSNGCEADLSGPCGQGLARTSKSYVVKGSCGEECVNCNVLPGAYNIPDPKSECLPIYPQYYADWQKFQYQLGQHNSFGYRFVHVCSTETIVPVANPPQNYFTVEAWKSVLCDPLSCVDDDYVYENGCELAVDYPFEWANSNKVAWNHWYSPLASNTGSKDVPERTYWVRDDGVVTIWQSNPPQADALDYWTRLFDLTDATLGFSFTTYDVRTVAGWSFYQWYNWSAELAPTVSATYSFTIGGSRGNNVFPYTGASATWDCSNSELPSGVKSWTIGSVPNSITIDVPWTLTTSMPGPWFHVNQSAPSTCRAGPDPGATSAQYSKAPPVTTSNFCGVSNWGTGYNKDCYDAWVTPGSGRCALNCETDWKDLDADPSNGCESYIKNKLPYPGSFCGTTNAVDPALDSKYPNGNYNYNKQANCGAGLCLNCQFLGGVNQGASGAAGTNPTCIDGGDNWFSLEADNTLRYQENAGLPPTNTYTGVPTPTQVGPSAVMYPGDYYCFGVINENSCLRLQLAMSCNGIAPCSASGPTGVAYPKIGGGRTTIQAGSAFIKVCADYDDAWETGCEVALAYNVGPLTIGPSTNAPSFVTSVKTSTSSTIQLRGIYNRRIGVKPYYDKDFAVIDWSQNLPAAGFDCEILRYLPRAHTHITPQTGSGSATDVIACGQASAYTNRPGQCTFKCDAGWTDWDRNPWNGCENFNLLCGGTGSNNVNGELTQRYTTEANFACTDLNGRFANGDYTRQPFCDGNAIPFDDWHIFWVDNTDNGANTDDSSQYDDRFEIEDHGIDFVNVMIQYIDPDVSRYTIKGYWDNEDVDYVCRVWLNGTGLRSAIPADGNAATGKCVTDCNAANGYSECNGLIASGCDSHILDGSCRNTAGDCIKCSDIAGTRTLSSSKCLSKNIQTNNPVNSFVINWPRGDAGVQVGGTGVYVVRYGNASGSSLPPINVEFPQCDTRGVIALGPNSPIAPACNDDLCRDYDGDWENGCEFPMNYTVQERENWETPAALYAAGQTAPVVDGFDCSWITDPQPDAGGRNYGGKTWAQKHHVLVGVKYQGECIGFTGQPDSGKCRINCESGWTDCDKDPSNGCETDNTKCSSCTIALGYADQQPVDCSTLNDPAHGFIAFAQAPKCNGREGQDGQCSYYMCNIFDGFCDSGLGAVLNFATGQGSGCIDLDVNAGRNYCGIDWNWRDIRGNMSTVGYSETEDYDGGRMLDYSNFDGTGRCASCANLNGYESNAACVEDSTVAGHTFDFVTYYKPAASGWIDNSLGSIYFETAGNTLGEFLCELHGDAADRDGQCDRNLCVDEDYYWANGCETAVNYPASLFADGVAGDQRHSVSNSGDFGFDYHFAYNDVNFGRNWPYNAAINGQQESGVMRSEVRGVWCPFLQFWSLSTDNYITGDCDVFPCPHFHPDTVTTWITCVNNASLANAGQCNFQCNVEDGWKDCDSNPLTGCETDIFNDGTCGSNCEAVECNALPGLNPFYWSECLNNNGVSSCDLSICEQSLCRNADSNWVTGCETAVNYLDGKTYNCRALSTPSEMARLHLASIEPCNGEPGNHWAGKCEFTCAPGWVDCDGDFANGCEHDGSLCQDCTKALGYVTNFDGADWWQFWGPAKNSSETFYSVVYGSYFDQNTRKLSSFTLEENAFLDTNNILNDQFDGPNVAYSKYHHAFVAAFDCSELATTYPGQFASSVTIKCDADVTSATAGRCVYACNAAAGYFDCDGDPRNGCEHFSQHTACGLAGACRNCYYMSGIDYPVDTDGDGVNNGSQGPYTNGAFDLVSQNSRTYGDVYAEANVTYFGLVTSVDLRDLPNSNTSPLRLGCVRDPSQASKGFTCNLDTCVTTTSGFKPCNNANQALDYGWKDGCEVAQGYDFNNGNANGKTFDCSLMGPDVSKGDAPRPTNNHTLPSFHVRQVVGTFGCDFKEVDYPTNDPRSIWNGRGAWRYIVARLGRSDGSGPSVNETSGIYAFDYAGLEQFFRTNDDLTPSQVSDDGLNALGLTVNDFVLYRVRGGDRQGTCYYECEYGYDDCDGDPRNGCEVKVSACVDADGLIGWDWLAGAPTNGCETALGYTAGQLNDRSKPASERVSYNCLNMLGQQNVNTTAPIYCRGGQDGNLDNLGTCQFSCLPGFQDCDGNPDNGCEAEIGDESCSCVVCSSSNSLGYLPGTLARSSDPLSTDSSISQSTCVNNQCTLPCDTQFCRDADNDWKNGCETAVAYPTPRNATAIGSWDCSIWAKEPLRAKRDHIDLTKLGLIGCFGRVTDGLNRGTCSFQSACLQRSNGGLFDYQDCNNDPRDGCEDTNEWCSVGKSAATNPRGTLSDRCSKALKYTNPNFDCEDITGEINTTALLPYCDRDATNLKTRGDCVFVCNTGFANCDGLATNGCEADVTTNRTCDYDCVNCNILPGIDRTAAFGCVADPDFAGRFKCQYSCVGGNSATSCADRDGDWRNGCETALNGDDDEESIFVNENLPMDCSVMQAEAKKNPELFRHHLHIDLTVPIPTSVDTYPAGSIFCNGLITADDTAFGKCYFACIPGFYNQDRKSFNGCEAAYTDGRAYPFLYGGYQIGDYHAEAYIAFLAQNPTRFTLPIGIQLMNAHAGSYYGLLPVVWY